MLPIPCVSISPVHETSLPLPIIPPLGPPVDISINISFPPIAKLTQLQDIIHHLEDIIRKRQYTLILYPADLHATLVELNNLPGLESVKSQVAEHMNHIIHNLRTYLESIPHTIILGPPTAPKHLLASYLGRIWKWIGHIRNKKTRIFRLFSELTGPDTQQMIHIFEEVGSRALMFENADFLNQDDLFAQEVTADLINYIAENPNPIIILELETLPRNRNLCRRFQLRFTLEGE